LPGIELRIMAISDSPIAELDRALLLKTGEIGEIIVRGDVVTKAYQNNPEETRLAKIRDRGSFWHRMGDVGYLDGQERLWFCGRRAHRVVTGTGTLYSIPCEAIINEHPEVYRAALVGIKGDDGDGLAIPVIIVEPRQDKKLNGKQLLAEVTTLAGRSELTRGIKHFLVHDGFPVDIRHNAKIFREQLAKWAEKKISPR
jgi:acyl-CoA synthetase (AMP-forming)/AMP-acid ligase II